ncbi:MAG: hypothetical protein ABJA37_03970 [Ferruginibacter sp.]
MKIFLTVLFIFILAQKAEAQIANVIWGDEFKMRKGSTDLSVIYADNTGVFVREGHRALKGYFVIAATTRESATLIKLDKNLAEVYKSDFNKELKGKEFEDFFFIQNRLFLLASDYNKRERTLTLLAAEINKADGEMLGDWKELTSWQKDDKKDNLDFKTSCNADSSKMIVVSTSQGKEKNTYEVKEFDSKMTPLAKTASISNEFDPKTFQLEDVIYTLNGNIVMVGRIYEYEEGKKKKTKNLVFQNYNIRVYTNTGTLVKEINTDIEARWLVSTKVAQIPNRDIVLAAFYSNTKKGKEINGMLVQRIDPTTGLVISTSQKELNTSMISVLDDAADDDDESKKEKKEREKLEKIQEDEEGFSKYMRLRNFVYTDDKGLVILAERYHHYTYTTYSTTSTGAGIGASIRSTSTTYDVYDCGDIMMSKMDAAGNVNWLHVLPKNQSEVVQSGRSSSGGLGLSFSMGHSYFDNSFNFPYYAGLASVAVPGKNMVSVIFNDNSKNGNVLQLGQKVKSISRFGKGECYAVDMDATTGKYTRSSLFSNNDIPTAMPRLGVALGKEFYLIGKDDRIFGKTKIAVGKLTFK